MASWEKRGEGYSVRWHDPDGTARRRQVPDVATARALSKEVDRVHALGRRWDPADAGEHSLPQILDAYLKDRERVWKPDTYQTNDCILSVYEAWVVATVRRKRIGPDVWTKRHLAAFWSYLVDERELQPDSANKYVVAVQTTWAWAADEDYDVPRPRRIDLPTIVREETVAPTWNEIDAMIAEAPSDVWHRFLIVLRCTGLRPGQAAKLLWSDFDLKRGVLHVRGELGKTPHERKGRRVPIAPVLLEHLVGWGKREGAIHGHEKGVAWDPPLSSARRMWGRTGADRSIWRQPFHSFRKAFKTELRAAGADSDAVDFLQGHKLSGERDTYTDPRAHPLVAAVRLVPQLVDQEGVSRRRANAAARVARH